MQDFLRDLLPTKRTSSPKSAGRSRKKGPAL
jgi:hypothetical protein